MSSFNVEPILKERYTDLGAHTRIHCVLLYKGQRKRKSEGRAVNRWRGRGGSIQRALT